MKNGKLAKKMLSLIMCVIMVAALLPAQAIALDAKDVSGHWSAPAIDKCNGYGIMLGSGGYFRPNDPITVAEFCAMVNRSFGFTYTDGAKSFTDVKTSAWYASDIRIASAMGYMLGNGDGTTSPESNIPRERAFTMLARVYRLEGDTTVKTQFSDDALIASWARGAIFAMSEAGYINGSGGRVNPNATITRGETAQVLCNICGDIADSSSDSTATYQNLTIRSGDIALENAVVTGDLYITEGAGNITLGNVTVKGRVIMANSAVTINGGTMNTVLADTLTPSARGTLALSGATLGSITANRPLDITGTGTVNTMLVHVGGLTIASGIAVNPDNIVTDKDLRLNIGGKDYVGTGEKSVRVSSDSGSGSGGHSVTYYTVSFNTHSDSPVESQRIASGGKAAKPVIDPTKTGYVFAGWFDAETGGNAFDFDMPITKSTTVHAQWSAYTITPAATNITYGQTLTDSTITPDSAILLSDGITAIPGTWAWADDMVAHTAGTHDYTATFTPTDTTYAARSFRVSVTVDKLQLTIANPTLTTAKTYDGTTTAVFVAGALSNKIGSDDVYVDTTLSAANYDTATVGTGKAITVTYAIAGTDAGNYLAPESYTATGVITKGTPGITANPTIASFEYGTALSDGLLTGGSGSVPGTFWLTTQGGTVLAAGTHNNIGITFTPTDTTNFNTVTETISVQVNPKAITITPSASQSKTYGGADPTFTYSNTALVGTDTLTGALSRTSGENAGSYAYTLGTLSAGGNYQFTLAANAPTFTVSPKPIRINPTAGQNKTYGDSDPAFAYSVDASTPLVGSDTLSGELGRAPGENADIYVYSIGTLQTSNPNYAFTLSARAFEIRQRALTGITGLSATKEYDSGTAATVTGTPVFTDMVSGDNLIITGGTATFDNKNAGTNKTVTYSGYTIGGTSLGNYDVTAITTTTFSGTITQKAITAITRLTAQNKLYDGSASATAVTTAAVLTGIVPGDTVTIDAVTATFDSAAAGTGKTVTFTGITLTGADAGNYALNLAASPSTTADIYTLEVKVLTASGASSGSVSINSTSGATFNITASPTAPYEFLKWVSSDDINGAQESTNATETITITQYTTLYAVFSVPTANLQSGVKVVGGVVSKTGTGPTGALVIPSVVDGVPVTSIDDFAFYDCNGLTGVSIPNSVTTIGLSAFEDCSGLTGVTIPDSVTTIAGFAFAGCTGLTGALTIPASVTTIAGFAFAGCTELTGVTIPDSVTTIGRFAFEDCSGLTGVTIPDSVTKIDSYAFRDCSGLTGALTIPNSVTIIYNGTFEGCSGLTGVSIPNSVQTIGSSAFSGCSRLTGVSIPNSVTSIDDSAFEGCSGLTGATFEGARPSLGSNVFLYCNSLTNIYYITGQTGWPGGAINGITPEPLPQP